MHFGLELLQPLLVLDAEMLLFTNDQQTEPHELDAFRQHRMGTDHDIDGAVGQAFLGCRCTLGRHHAGQLLDRSEEHTSELQSLMRISYAVFCLKTNTKHIHNITPTTHQPYRAKNKY